jgi:hypothetical protein
VVDEVVEEHASKAHGARIVGDELLAVRELPGLGEVLVAGGHQRRPASCSAFVELLEGSFGGGEDERRVRTLGRGEIHAVVFDDIVAEKRESGAVHGQLSERHGLVVTLKVVFAFGHALEGAAGVRDFDVKVLEEDFSDGHRSSSLRLVRGR